MKCFQDRDITRMVAAQNESRRIARTLAASSDEAERQGLHARLMEVNAWLGIPTEPLEVWDRGYALPNKQDQED